jgi:alanine-alpha-ketoisovalerate/valine-pyruvate aminotransferase
MNLSNFGEKLTRTAGVSQMMDDPDSAMEGHFLEEKVVHRPGLV